METISTSKSKATFEWVVLLFTTIINIGIGVLGVILLIATGDIFDQIFGFLMIIIFVIIAYLEYQFYIDNPWGWFFLLILNYCILIVMIFAGFSQPFLDLMNDFYLDVFKGFSEALVQSIGGVASTYTFDLWFNDIFLKEDSFISHHSFFIFLLLTLIGIYWSIRYLSGEYSEREISSVQRNGFIFLIAALLTVLIGIFVAFYSNTLNVVFSGIVGSIGFILLFFLMRIEFTEERKTTFSKVLLWGTIFTLGILSFNILIFFTIIISAITISLLRDQSIRHKFDILGTAEQREEQTAITFIIPTAAVVVGIVLIPVIWIILASFFNVGLRNVGTNPAPADFVLFYNYLKLIDDPEFYTAIFTSILYTIIGTTGSVLMGLGAALLINRSFPGRGIVRSVMIFPYIASTVAMVLLWTWAFDVVYGVFNFFLMELGLISRYEPWLDQIPWAFGIVVLFEIWKYFPFAMLMILAQLQAISHELYEAADIDGANDFQKFWHITLPELRYVLGVVVLLRFIWTFNKFDDVWLFTTGSIETGTLVLPVYIFDKVWTGVLFKISEAAAVAVVLFLGLLAFSLIFGRKVLKW
ncbi:MAG: carbohydrate ABC transporter permease [Candidatus Hodarchaeales archaeon]|jgi:multiple sugar transport system permease protein